MPEVSLSPDGTRLTVLVPMRFGRRSGRKTVIMAPAQIDPIRANPPLADDTLPRAVARAFHWKRLYEGGTHPTLAALARAEGVTESYVSRVLKLTLLAPDLIERILDGRISATDRVMRAMHGISAVWTEQRKQIAVP